MKTHPKNPKRPQVGIPFISVTSDAYGAAGDGHTDDTAAIQSAINSAYNAGGGIVYLPPGIYIISGAPALRMRTGVNILGCGIGVTTLHLAPNQPDFSRMLNCAAVDNVRNIFIRDITLDGDHSSTESPGEHTSAIFTTGVANIRIENIETCRTHGDGIEIFDNCRGVKIVRCEIHNSLRNGITLDGVNSLDIYISGNSIHDIKAQPIDSEPTTSGNCNDVSIIGNRIESNASHSITTGGSNAQNERWKIIGNSITGGIHLINCLGIKIIGNSIMGNAFRGPIYAQEHAENVTISDNTIVSNASDTFSTIAVLATANGSPRSFIIKDNYIETNSPVTAAIQIQSTNDVEISGNRIQVNNTSPRTILIRPTTADMENIEIYGNRLTSSVANPDGIYIWGNTAYSLGRIRVHHNLISDAAGSQPTGGIEVVPGTGTYTDIDIADNYIASGVSSPYQGLLLGSGHRSLAANASLTIGIGDKVIELSSTDTNTKAATMNTNGVPTRWRVRTIVTDHSGTGSYTIAATRGSVSGTVTLGAVDDGVDLLFDGSVWRVIGILGSAAFA